MVDLYDTMCIEILRVQIATCPKTLIYQLLTTCKLGLIDDRFGLYLIEIYLCL